MKYEITEPSLNEIFIGKVGAKNETDTDHLCIYICDAVRKKAFIITTIIIGLNCFVVCYSGLMFQLMAALRILHCT